MLFFLGLISCFFIRHKPTSMFIGAEFKKYPSPGAFEHAVDFLPLGGMGGAGRIVIDNKGQAFDVRGSVSGTLLDYFPTHKRDNQTFIFALNSDGLFLLIQDGKCVDWDLAERQFVKKSCHTATYSTFDIYYEISSAKDEHSQQQQRPRPQIDDQSKKYMEMLSRKLKKNEERKLEQMLANLSPKDLLKYDDNNDKNSLEFKKFLLKNLPTNNKRKKCSEDDGCSEEDEDDSCDEYVAEAKRRISGLPLKHPAGMKRQPAAKHKRNDSSDEEDDSCDGHVTEARRRISGLPSERLAKLEGRPKARHGRNDRSGNGHSDDYSEQLKMLKKHLAGRIPALCLRGDGNSDSADESSADCNDWIGNL